MTEEMPAIETPTKLTLRSCLVSSLVVLRDHWPKLLAGAFVRDIIATIAGCLAFAASIDATDWCLWIALACSFVVHSGLQCGYLRFCDYIRQNKKANWKLLFGGFDLTMDMLFATVCLTCAVGLGLILLVVPGLFLATRWSLYGMNLVDQKLDSEKSLAASYKMLKGFGWLALFCTLIYVVGRSILDWWEYGFEALYVVMLWTLYRHIRAQEGRE